MSKLFEKYKYLKNMNNKKVYIFLIGKFYTCLGEDAILLNKIFGYKIKDFYSQTTKVGFPVEGLSKVEKILKINNIEYEIFNKTLLENHSIKDNILQDIQSIDMNNTTFKQAFEKLLYYQKILNSKTEN